MVVSVKLRLSRVWVRGVLYNGLYREAPPERGTFFMILVYERVGISLVEVHERGGKSVIAVDERLKRANRCICIFYNREFTVSNEVMMMMMPGGRG